MSNIVPTSALSLVPDEVFRTAADVTSAIQRAERLERIGVTLKLYIIARAIRVLGFSETHEVVTAASHHTEQYVGRLMAVASLVGEDRLRHALEDCQELTFDQWQAIAETPQQKKDEAYRLAVQDDANPIEIRAAADNTSLGDAKAKWVLDTLWRALHNADRLGLREEVTKMLREFGYLPRVVASSRVKLQ